MHQAEDEIAAIGFAIGSSFAGKTACTITSGPGLALKTEMVALAVMAEIPLVLAVVQRGGPSTGLPTKVEQGDLLACPVRRAGGRTQDRYRRRHHQECLEFVIMSRRLAEAFRTPVILLTDANLATGVQPYPRPQADRRLAGAAHRPVGVGRERPALRLGREDRALVAPHPRHARRRVHAHRAGPYRQQQGGLRLGFQSAQCRHAQPQAGGAAQLPEAAAGARRGQEGDLLVVSWGSTMGAIEEGVDRARAQGHKVSHVHLRFLSPLEPGLKEIFGRFRKVMTVEINYSDDPEAPLITDETRRYAQLATLLRAQTLMDVDCWSVVYGHPLQPGMIHECAAGTSRRPERGGKPDVRNQSRLVGRGLRPLFHHG